MKKTHFFGSRRNEEWKAYILAKRFLNNLTAFKSTMEGPQCYLFAFLLLTCLADGQKMDLNSTSSSSVTEKTQSFGKNNNEFKKSEGSKYKVRLLAFWAQ